MLRLEDLMVANLAARQGFLAPGPLRGLLEQLDAAQERLGLAQQLHEQRLLAPEHVRTLHDAARRRIYRLFEEAYLAQARHQQVLPGPVLDTLSHEQARDGYVWPLGERLVRDHGLAPQLHQKLLQDAQRRFGEHERTVLHANRSAGFAPTIGGGAPSDSGRVQLATSSEVLVPPGSAGQSWAPQTAGGNELPPEGPGPRHTGWVGPGSEVGAVESGSDSADFERTMELDSPSQPFAPPGLPASDDRTVRFRAVLPNPEVGPGPGAYPGAPQVAEGEVDPFATIQKKPAQAAADPDRTITLSADEVARSANRGQPSVIGSYQIVRELGRGNMGVVYLARSPDSGVFVAVKLVLPGHTNDEAGKRFEREILVSKRVSHEHVIAVHDAGQQPDGARYMVMEYLEGEPLRTLLEREAPLPASRALDLLAQLTQGLAAVHASNVVHRDLKPENVQVVRRMGDDHLKIMDFGIARFLDQQETEPEVFVTMRGTLSGTPAYVAPEAVLDPEDVRASHDVYALGVIFYELLTGKLPFPANRSLRDILTDTLHARPTPLAEANPAGAPYAPDVEALVRKLLEKDPMLRPQTAGDLLDEVQRCRGQADGSAPAADGGRRQPAPGKGKRKQAKSKISERLERRETFTQRLFKGITALFRRP